MSDPKYVYTITYPARIFGEILVETYECDRPADNLGREFITLHMSDDHVAHIRCDDIVKIDEKRIINE